MIKTGFSLQKQYSCPITQVIRLLKDACFSAISPVWSRELDLRLIAKSVDKLGMCIQSIHAPHGGLYYLWHSNDPLSFDYQKNITDCIESCATYNVPLMVMHGWQGLDYTFPDTPLDFTIFDRIVDLAERKGVSVAFENLEGEEYLDALMSRYKYCSHIGYCWDSGHEHCYPHELNFLETFGDRLIMTHLHDNLGLRDPNGIPTGNDDLHFLPFDGNIDWENNLVRLKGLPRQEILNFELKIRSASSALCDLIYDELSIEEYISLAGQRAREIANLYEQIITRN